MNFAETRPLLRLLIFDLDGTLIDSKKDLAVSVNATLQNFGRQTLDDETIFSYVGRGAPALIRRAFGEDTPVAELDRALEYFLRYYGEHSLDHTVLYPGVRETLERLANHEYPAVRTLAVLTNKPERISRDILAGLNVASFFRFVYGGNSFPTKKPDPLGALTLLREAGSAPSAAMIVGDSDVDILTGRNAGIWTCGVTYGFGTLRSEVNPPDLIIDRLPELVAHLNGTTEVSSQPPQNS
jgi:phosphoglycolate phosphatase